MPNNIVKSFAKKSGKSVEQIEKMWRDLSKQHGKNYAYIVASLKRMLKLDEEDETFNAPLTTSKIKFVIKLLDINGEELPEYRKDIVKSTEEIDDLSAIYDEIEKNAIQYMNKCADENPDIESYEVVTDISEESQAAITTTSVGNIASYGGEGNYAPKVAMLSRFMKGKTYNHHKKKRKRKNESWDFIVDKMNNLLGE